MKWLLLIFFATPLMAANDPPLMQTGIGLFDIGHSNQGMLQLEYRGGHSMYHIHTLAGAYLTTDESFYGCLGLAYDIGLGEKWKLTPSFAVGGYAQGNGVDLGSWLLFRPAIDVSRVWSTKIRLGLHYSYLSDFNNRGANNLSLFISIPLTLIL